MPGIGIDLDVYSRRRVGDDAASEVRRGLGLTPEDTLLLTVAAFDPGKRHADLLRAFRQAHRPGLHLAFAGTGPMMESMRSLAAELDVAGSVHFLGQRSDVPALLAASTALVHPSAREGLPRSILEAMAMQTAVVGTDIRGTGELLAGGAGWLVKVGDVAGLAAAIDQAVTGTARRAACVRRARVRVARYALPRVLALHEELYEEVLSGAQAPAGRR